jgi:tyrosyl-tRNA synthetase
VELELASSKAEARRLIEQGGVYVDGERCDAKANKYYLIQPGKPGHDIKVGKRRFVRVRGK